MTSTAIADPSSDKAFKILSLCGGGYLGVYTASILAELEERAGEPLGRRFDLIAGTSVGGILAIALCFELPMRSLEQLFLQHGKDVFSSRPLPQGPLARLMDLGRSVLGPKYEGTALRTALERQLGTSTMNDALHSIVVPAVNLSRSVTKVFKTPHSQTTLGDKDTSALDVAMATSAAPGFFPAVQIGETLYADGGMFAVAPDQVALHEAEHFMGIEAARVHMLSIGTGISGYQPSLGPKADAGAVGWLRDGRLLLTLIAVQQQHVHAMMEDRLHERYLRLDGHWPPDAGLGIDVATPESTHVLRNMARATMKEATASALSDFLD